jgi:hypothetical protein
MVTVRARNAVVYATRTPPGGCSPLTVPFEVLALGRSMPARRSGDDGHDLANRRDLVDSLTVA